MKKLHALVLFCVVGTAWAQSPTDDLLADSKPIAGEELKARLTGKSFEWKAASARFTAKVQYNANGYAFINVSSGQNDSGPWKVDGAQLCSQWQKLQSSCAPEVRSKGDVLLIKRVDGTWATMTPG